MNEKVPNAVNVYNKTFLDERTARTNKVWANASTGNPFLTDTMREDIVNGLQNFTVLAIRDGITSYGETWFVDIELHGQRYTIPQAKNAVRDVQMEALKEGLQDGPIDASLVAFSTTKGVGYSLAPPYDYDETVPLPDTMKSGTVEPDDVPF